jgi:DNA helicase HerA-like ATPase
MTDTPASNALTDSLLGVIRQQRHYGVRVIISTQEPTISPRLIDLCSMTVIHRFSSPEWFSVLRRHISIFDDSNSGKAVGLFQKIVSLKTGEAHIFAPSTIVGSTDGDGKWVKLSEGMLKVTMRKRLTWDGGRSVVAV